MTVRHFQKTHEIIQLEWVEKGKIFYKRHTNIPPHLKLGNKINIKDLQNQNPRHIPQIPKKQNQIKTLAQVSMTIALK